MPSRNVKNDMRHAAATHERWLDRRNRRQGEPTYLAAWYAAQCGACRFWVPLSGALGMDYGACTNPASAFDGSIRFEHDGCDAFEASGEWAQPDTDVAIEDPGIHPEHVPAIRELFRQHGYDGPLSVVDDQADEATFLVPAEALLALREPSLSASLQALLRRKVWVVNASPTSMSRGRAVD